MNHKIYIFYIIFIVGFFKMNSQNKGQTYIKGNAISVLLAIPNVGIETSIGEKTTFQVDVLASFWNSINGLPYKFVTVTPEIRYHFNEKFGGIYAGAHLGGAVYKVSKGIHTKIYEYQEGFGYLMGATVGYQKKINNKLVLDFFLGGGYHHGFYKGYNIKTGERYDGAKNYNKSGEWLPYRGGVMVCYKLN
jgi:hypothetical protein